MKLIFNTCFTKRRYYETWIDIPPIPRSFCYDGNFGISTEDEEDMNNQLNSLFGVSLDELINVLFSKCGHGYDHQGLFCVNISDVGSKKRPKRIRFTNDLEQRHIDFINHPEINSYSNKDVHYIYECSNCHREGGREKWRWAFVPGICNSEYITECPECGCKNGDIFDKIKNNNYNLKIIKKLSHNAPYLLQSSEPYKEVGCINRGELVHVDKECHYIKDIL